jgi:hypothetical protein
MAPKLGGSAKSSKKRKSTSKSAANAKKSKSNLGTSSHARLVSIHTEEEDEEQLIQSGISQVITSDEEGNITSVQNIGANSDRTTEGEDKHWEDENEDEEADEDDEAELSGTSSISVKNKSSQI